MCSVVSFGWCALLGNKPPHFGRVLCLMSSMSCAIVTCCSCSHHWFTNSCEALKKTMKTTVMKKNLVYPLLIAVIGVILRALFFLYSIREKICPIAVCIGPLIASVRNPDDRAMLDCLDECDDKTSDRRNRAALTFKHVQFPQDSSLCRYGCFDLVTTATAERLIECIGGSGCIAAAEYSDECASIRPEQVLPFDSIPPNVMSGRWIKLYTNSWDTWPCQVCEFHPPRSNTPAPRPWMKHWPNDRNVWRMDMNWTNTLTRHVFSMSNEIYPNESWDFSTKTKATLKTRAAMWGSEAKENWYLLHYDPETLTMIFNVCAYTAAVQKFDALTMVIRKLNAPGLFTDDMAKEMESKALDMLGPKFGNMVRIPQCNITAQQEKVPFSFRS